MQPGWLTFTANTRGYPADNYIILHIRVENKAVSYAQNTGYDTLTVTYTAYFYQFDLEMFSKTFILDGRKKLYRDRRCGINHFDG